MQNYNYNVTPTAPPTSSTQSLSVGFLNVCSVRRKVAEVQTFISTRGIHVLAIAETWLTPDVSDQELSIPHFKLYRRDRPDQRGGGVAVYCHESLAVRQRADVECELEMLWLEILAPGRHGTLLGCCYRPPNSSAAYWTALDQNIEQAVQGCQQSTVLLGDFNVDFSNPTSPSASPLYNILSHYNLCNYVTSPTRVTATSSMMLDLFLSTSPLDGTCEAIHLDISDHFAVLARLNIHTHQHVSSSVKTTRRLHRVNWDSFSIDLQRKQQQDFDAHSNIHDMVHSFTSSIMSTLDQYAPLVPQRKRARRPCPWLTDELVGAVRKRNHLHRLLMRDQANVQLRDQHREARAMARRLDRKLRNQFFTEQCRTSDQRKLWRVLNVVTGRQKKAQVPQASLQDLSETFGSAVHDPARPATLQAPLGPTQQCGFSAFQPVAVSAVESCLSSVDPSKATGSDGVPGLLLHKFSSILAPNLTKLINYSLRTGQLPSTFKSSHVTPLFKGGDPTSPTNYRPVSLLPIISRILEAFVKKQLTTYLESAQLLPTSQFAYRKQHSTEDALALAVNRWSLAKSRREYTGVVFVDMSKAFDRVQHERLLTELFSLGISGTPLTWFADYLSGRFQQIRVQGHLSPAVSCSRGVPQGSVLGPLLFVLYTSTLSTILPPAVNHQEFADDITLDCSDTDPTEVCRTLSHAITSLATWLEDIGLLLNAAKTQLLFIKPRGADDTQPEVFCHADKLAITPSAKYLGVILDEELSWKPHIAHLSRKTARTIGQLWRHGQGLSLRARRTWFLSMVLSQLCYGSNSFVPGLSAQLLGRLEKSFKAGIRATLQQRFLTPPHRFWHFLV